jgi:hypothetical protein
VQRAALDVGEQRGHEEQAGHEEDHRREPEGVLGHHADRDVQARDDRAQRDREQRRLAEPAHDLGAGELRAAAELVTGPSG